MIGDITQVYSGERAKVDSGFHKIYEHAVRMADKVGSQPSKRRSGQNLRQQHRSNAPAETIEEYYKRNSAIPFLDHVISNLESRFSPLARTASSLLCLVPSIICSEQISWGEVVDAYEGDLPSPELVDMEVGRWKAKYHRTAKTHWQQRSRTVTPTASRTCGFFPSLPARYLSRHVNVSAAVVHYDACATAREPRWEVNGAGKPTWP